MLLLIGFHGCVQRRQEEIKLKNPRACFDCTIGQKRVGIALDRVAVFPLAAMLAQGGKHVVLKFAALV